MTTVAGMVKGCEGGIERVEQCVSEFVVLSPRYNDFIHVLLQSGFYESASAIFKNLKA